MVRYRTTQLVYYTLWHKLAKRRKGANLATLEATGISSFCSDIKFCPNIQFLLKHPAFARISSFCPNIQLLLEHPVFVRISSFSSDIRFSTEYSCFYLDIQYLLRYKVSPKNPFFQPAVKLSITYNRSSVTRSCSYFLVGSGLLRTPSVLVPTLGSKIVRFVTKALGAVTSHV